MTERATDTMAQGDSFSPSGTHHQRWVITMHSYLELGWWIRPRRGRAEVLQKQIV